MKNPFDGPLAGKKILFATTPAILPVNPLTSLARYLQFAGCDVRWYAPATLKSTLEKIEIQHYGFRHAKNPYTANEIAGLSERKLLSSEQERINYDLANFVVKRTPEYFIDLSDIYKTFRFDILICDSFFPAIPFVRFKMRVPVIAVGVLPLAEDSADLAPFGSGLPPAHDYNERAAYAAMREALYNSVYEESIDLFSAMLDGNDIVHTRSVLFDTLIRQANLHLQIGPASFEYFRNDCGNHIHFIGGVFPPSIPGDRPHWFDERVNQYNTVILVTHGCREQDAGKLLIPTLEAFKNTDTLIIATTGGTDTETLRERYTANNIIIEDFISFDDVMRHAHVFITNGGYGGVLSSLKYGVPVVAAGTQDLRNEVCARVAYFDCGINLGTECPDVDTLRYAVHTILQTDVYRSQARQFADRLKAYDPFALVKGHISRMLQQDRIPIL